MIDNNCNQEKKGLNHLIFTAIYSLQIGLKPAGWYCCIVTERESQLQIPSQQNSSLEDYAWLVKLAKGMLSPRISVLRKPNSSIHPN